jgi:hypothetical protein
MKKFSFILFICGICHAGMTVGFGGSYEKSLNQAPQLITSIGYVGMISCRYRMSLNVELQAPILVKTESPSLNLPVLFFYKLFCIGNAVTIDKSLKGRYSAGAGFMYGDDFLVRPLIFYDFRNKQPHGTLLILKEF